MKREQWSSDFGFLMAAAGSAVGLGNLWKFPYVVGMNGGGIFLLTYIVLIVLLGVPILMTEMAIGRKTRLNAISACEKLGKNWGFTGVAGVVGAFIILCYYGVIGGWVMKYMFKYIFSSKIENPDVYFESFSSSIGEPILWQLLFCIISIIIVVRGISNGIEKISKIFLPMLAVFIILIAINSISLPNASEGLKFFLVPDVSKIDGISGFFNVILSAMGQVFFSLSLGMGTLITYGSYLSKESSIQKNAFFIPLFDLLIAVLACFAILPAVFSFGLKPQEGSGLIFKTLPYVFGSMKFGRIFGIIFFVLVFFAAITSSISLIEVIASYFIDRFKWSRIKACIIPFAVFGSVGAIASLSFGILADVKILGNTFFEFLTIISDNILMPIGGFCMCILAGYVWGIPNLFKEISSDGRYKVYFKKTWTFLIKYLSPLMILVIFVTSFV